MKAFSGLILVLLLLGTAACRSEVKQHETVEIKLSGWQSSPSESKLLAKLLKDFESQNPNISVKHEVINSQYMDVIRTRLIGNVAPDVFYLEAFEAPLFMKYGVLEPLEAYIKPPYHLSDFEPNLLNAFRYQGKLYGIPKDFSTLALFYDKTALAQAHLNGPPKTWTELVQSSKKLTVDRNQDGRMDQYGLGIVPELPRQVFMLQAFGGQLADANGYGTFADPNRLQGLQLLIDQYQRDRTAVQATDVGASSNSEAFGRGNIAMAIEGAWAIPYLQDNFPQLKFGTAEIPTINGRKGTMAFTVAYVINRESKHKAAAWQLIEYLTSRAGMQAWVSQGLALPSRRSVTTALHYDRNPLYGPLMAGATYATIWQFGATAPILATHFDNQLLSALLGQRSLSSAMERAQTKANRDIYLSN
ncbi:MAG: ABC transporter substrate-binding protein [Thermosynechococcaceae cyanobacterium]